MSEGSPTLSSSTIAGFPAGTQVSLKSDASADSATPARFQVSTNERLTLERLDTIYYLQI